MCVHFSVHMIIFEEIVVTILLRSHKFGKITTEELTRDLVTDQDGGNLGAVVVDVEGVDMYPTAVETERGNDQVYGVPVMIKTSTSALHCANL